MHARRARAAIVAGGAALFAATIGSEFTFDDRLTVEENTLVTGAFSLRKIFAHDYWGYALGDPEGPGTYRPLVTTTFWVDWHLAGGRPWLFHLVNVLFYSLTLLAADRFLARFAASISETARLLALAAFAAATIHVDVVASVTGRAEILAMLFVMVAAERAHLPEKRARDVVAIAAATTLAILSKESALPMGVFVAWLAWRSRCRLAVVAALVPVGAALLFRRAMHLPFNVSGERYHFLNPLHVAGPSLRAHGAVQAFGHYLQHLFAPLNLCPDYGYASLAPAPGGNFATVLGVLGIVTVTVALVASRRVPLLFDAALGLGLSYVVVSHVITRSMVFVADRVFYLPSFFAIVLAAIALDGLRDHARRIAWIAAFGLIAVQAVLTVLGALVWRDNYHLALWGVRACPTGVTVRLIRVVTAEERGQFDEAAWSLLVTADVFKQFPAPIPARLVSGDWEDEPVVDRMRRFRAARAPAHTASSCAAAHRLALARYSPQTASAVRVLCATGN